MLIQCCASAMLGVPTLLLLYERTKEVGVYISCYGVIHGWDQEFSR